ncbi:unannotated protein [freshwater metagenome]|uniref:Unannotated protein n=1 Tax=freshwater metagenome TaxID=449393 RepID=A0A6J7BRE2_9ZZZZ|nr:SDR family oxidoreductase [Actinomycetota bacterium]MSW37794.1 SDR family oxidoreductase [Actinomycetota bacterium]MSX38134.1 SDR family oxidoreductase [Actinomycetota bacterium]
MKMELSGTAVITGAAAGIGRAVAEILRDAGVDVLAVDRDERALATLSGMRTHICDLRSADERDALVAKASGTRYLVNSAGAILIKPILECTVADLRTIFELNVDATWDLTSRIGATMPTGGAIVNMSSAAARLNANTETAIYSASKAAVLSVTRSFAHAFAPGVRVNAVCPGMIDTGMQVEVLEGLARVRDSTPDGVLSGRLQTLPLGRMATAQECAGVIAFLLSDAAAYLTGQAISADGGLVML